MFHPAAVVVKGVLVQAGPVAAGVDVVVDPPAVVVVVLEATEPLEPVVRLAAVVGVLAVVVVALEVPVVPVLAGGGKA